MDVPIGECVDDEIEHDERGGHEEPIGLLDQRADPARPAATISAR